MREKERAIFSIYSPIAILKNLNVTIICGCCGTDLLISKHRMGIGGTERRVISAENFKFTDSVKAITLYGDSPYPNSIRCIDCTCGQVVYTSSCYYKTTSDLVEFPV